MLSYFPGTVELTIYISETPATAAEANPNQLDELSPFDIRDYTDMFQQYSVSRGSVYT